MDIIWKLSRRILPSYNRRILNKREINREDKISKIGKIAKPRGNSSLHYAFGEYSRLVFVPRICTHEYLYFLGKSSMVYLFLCRKLWIIQEFLKTDIKSSCNVLLSSNLFDYLSKHERILEYLSTIPLMEGNDEFCENKEGTRQRYSLSLWELFFREWKKKKKNEYALRLIKMFHRTHTNEYY